MAFCYVNALFQESIKCDCPDEVVKIIECYAKSMRLLKRVSDQLDICPRVSEFEQWEKEAQTFVNTKALRDRLLTLKRSRQHNHVPAIMSGLPRELPELYAKPYSPLLDLE